MFKKQSLIGTLLLMSEMAAIDAIDHTKNHKKQSKPSRKRKKRDCKICGDPVYRDSLTCSKECYLEHRKRVKTAP